MEEIHCALDFEPLPPNLPWQPHCTKNQRSTTQLRREQNWRQKRESMQRENGVGGLLFICNQVFFKAPAKILLLGSESLASRDMEND